MQINNSGSVNNNIQPITQNKIDPQTANQQNLKNETQSVKTDKVDFSFRHDQAKQDLIADVSAQLVKEVNAPNNSEKIEALKTQIKEDSYKIEPTTIADIMISTEK